MAERLEEIRHTLEVPFEYSLRGQMASAEFITLKPPTAKNRNECAKLEQAFMRALPDPTAMTDDQRESAWEAAAEVSEDPTASEALATIAMSPSSDLSEVMEVSRKLFLADVALIDGENKLNSNALDRMDLDDFKELVGKYLVGFILRFALDTQPRS